MHILATFSCFLIVNTILINKFFGNFFVFITKFSKKNFNFLIEGSIHQLKFCLIRIPTN